MPCRITPLTANWKNLPGNLAPMDNVDLAVLQVVPVAVNAEVDLRCSRCSIRITTAS